MVEIGGMRNSFLARAYGRELGAIVIDAQEAVRLSGSPSEKLFDPSKVHYPAAGGKILAHYIYDQVLQRRP